MTIRNTVHILVVLVFAVIAHGCDESPTIPDGGDGDWQPELSYPLIDEYPAWSPDGERIAYYHYGITHVDPSIGGGVRIDHDQAGIWLVETDGTGSRLFIQGGSHPAWSPDGGSMTFTMDYQLYTIRNDGTDIRRLTDSGKNLFPSWSPNGRRIAYNSKQPDGYYTIWILEVDGSRKIDTGLAGIYPFWSPDQRYMIYFSEDIWRIEVGAHVPAPLTGQLRGSCRFAAYSPDGKRIAFSFIDKNTTQIPNYPQIYVMDENGENIQQLTTGGGTQPTWSPDGSKIAYLSVRYNEYCSEHGTIWVMKATDGSDNTQLTFSPITTSD